MRQEFEVTIKVVLSVEDAEKQIPVDKVRQYADDVLSVSFDDESHGQAPDGAGEDATTSMAADIVDVKRI